MEMPSRSRRLRARSVIALVALITVAVAGVVAFRVSTLMAVGPYSIDESLRFNDDDTTYLSRTPGSAGSETTFTFSTWVRLSTLDTHKTVLSAGDSSHQFAIYFDTSNRLTIWGYASGSTQMQKITTRVFRDPAAWHHVVVAFDTIDGVAEDRVKLYIDGERVTNFSTNTNPASGYATNVNQAVAHGIGKMPWSTNYMDGYMADAYLVDGQALAPTAFGATDQNGDWGPQEYTGSYGTNGFHLDFTSSAGLGNDASGNANDWTSNNLDATDQVIDTPTSGYATFSSISNNGGTLSEGGTQFAGGDATAAITTMSITSGKWYTEMYYPDGTYSAYTALGWTETNRGLPNYNFYYASSNGYTSYAFGIDLNGSNVGAYGNKIADTSPSLYSSSPVYIATAFDYDNQKIWFGHADSNDSSITWLDGDPSAGTGGYDLSTYFVDGAAYAFGADGARSNRIQLNAGQDAFGFGNGNTDANGEGDFRFSVPTGFKALSTSNLPDVSIKQPDQYFDVLLFTAAPSSQQVSGLNFQPDFVWQKNRTSTQSHNLYDAVRSAFNRLRSDAATAEQADNDLTAFNADGFSGDLSAFSGDEYVAWNWRESATSGFDIVAVNKTTTGSQTYLHNLGAKPAMMILKNRDISQNWRVWHEALASETNSYLELNSTNAESSGSYFWGAAPSSGAFSLGTQALGWPADNYIAYLFAEKEGFSRFGTYTGNGSSDGSFVYTGFEPRWVVIKRTDSADEWWTFDTARDIYSPLSAELRLNSSGVEGDTARMDALANGFKLRTSSTAFNANGGTYIYAAFAEQPFKYSVGTDFATPTTGIDLTDNVYIDGTLTVANHLFKGSGTFVIDHPLDPKNKLLYHSFVESPEALNMYTGIARLNEQGEALVVLPRYYRALNTESNYFVTPLEQPMPDLYISREVRKRFFGLAGDVVYRISGGTPGGAVSWIVTGVRHDPYIEANPITPEAEKGPWELVEKGEYLHPEVFMQDHDEQ